MRVKSLEEGKQLRQFHSLKEFVTEYYRLNPDGHYFDNPTLYYYGEKLSEMRVSRDAELLPANGSTLIGGKYFTMPQWYEAFYLIKKVRRPRLGFADTDVSRFHDQTEVVYFDAATLQPVVLDELFNLYLKEESDVYLDTVHDTWKVVWMGDGVI